ncbi:hypothetical protein NFJ02_02g74260 [Pycnococcus provasolii]
MMMLVALMLSLFFCAGFARVASGQSASAQYYAMNDPTARGSAMVRAQSYQQPAGTQATRGISYPTLQRNSAQTPLPLPSTFPTAAQTMAAKYPLALRSDSNQHFGPYVLLKNIPRTTARTTGHSAIGGAVGAVGAAALTTVNPLAAGVAVGTGTALARAAFDAVCWLPATNVQSKPWSSLVIFSKDEFGVSGAPDNPFRDSSIGGVAHYSQTLGSVADSTNSLVCSPISPPKNLYGKAQDSLDLLQHMKKVLEIDGTNLPEMSTTRLGRLRTNLNVAERRKNTLVSHWRQLGSPTNGATASKAIHLGGDGRQGAAATLVAASGAEDNPTLKNSLRSAYIVAPSTLGVGGGMLEDWLRDEVDIDTTPVLFLSGTDDMVFDTTDLGARRNAAAGTEGARQAFEKTGVSPRVAVELIGGGHCWLRNQGGPIDSRAACRTGVYQQNVNPQRLPQDEQHKLGTAFFSSWVSAQNAVTPSTNYATSQWIRAWDLPWTGLSTISTKGVQF